MMNPTQQLLIDKTILFVQKTLKNAEGGHDWWHIERVWKTAKTLSNQENVDSFVVEMSALLHDIADSKFHNGDENIGPKRASEFLESLGIDNDRIQKIVFIIANMSFKGGKTAPVTKSLEFEVVQDADRLDALGAIGIARTFNYGGFKEREIYNPNISPNLNMTKEEYKTSSAPSINHFYEKLLLLKDLMNTKSGKKLAAERHRFMEKYLEQFYKEWNGEV